MCRGDAEASQEGSKAQCSDAVVATAMLEISAGCSRGPVRGLRRVLRCGKTARASGEAGQKSKTQVRGPLLGSVERILKSLTTRPRGGSDNEYIGFDVRDRKIDLQNRGRLLEKTVIIAQDIDSRRERCRTLEI